MHLRNVINEKPWFTFSPFIRFLLKFIKLVKKNKTKTIWSCLVLHGDAYSLSVSCPNVGANGLHGVAVLPWYAMFFGLVFHLCSDYVTSVLYVFIKTCTDLNNKINQIIYMHKYIGVFGRNLGLLIHLLHTYWDNHLIKHITLKPRSDIRQLTELYAHVNGSTVYKRFQRRFFFFF